MNKFISIFALFLLFFVFSSGRIYAQVLPIPIEIGSSTPVPSDTPSPTVSVTASPVPTADPTSAATVVPSAAPTQMPDSTASPIASPAIGGMASPDVTVAPTNSSATSSPTATPTSSPKITPVVLGVGNVVKNVSSQSKPVLDNITENAYSTLSDIPILNLMHGTNKPLYKTYGLSSNSTHLLLLVSIVCVLMGVFILRNPMTSLSLSTLRLLPKRIYQLLF